MITHGYLQVIDMIAKPHDSWGAVEAPPAAASGQSMFEVLPGHDGGTLKGDRNPTVTSLKCLAKHHQ